MPFFNGRNSNISNGETNHSHANKAELDLIQNGDKAALDAAVSKLSNIEENAKDDQTGAEIKTLLFAESDTNNFDDSYKNKVDSIDATHYLDPAADVAALTALTEASLSDKARVYVESETSDYFYDAQAVSGDEAPDDQTSGTGFWRKVAVDGETAASIKTKYESNVDTNAYNDADKAKVDNLPADANAELASKLDHDGKSFGGNGDEIITGTSVNAKRLIGFDLNGNAVAVDHLEYTKTGGSPQNFDLQLNHDRYNFIVGTDAGNRIIIEPNQVMFLNASNNGVRVKVPLSPSSLFDLILPDSDGDADQVLTTNGGGALSWTDKSSGSVTINDTFTSTATDEAASANRVKLLKDLIDGIEAILNVDDALLDTSQERIDRLKQLESDLASIDEGGEIIALINTVLTNTLAEIDTAITNLASTIEDTARTFKAPQRTQINTSVTNNAIDLSVANDHEFSTTAHAISFTNLTAGQKGTIHVDNTSDNATGWTDTNIDWNGVSDPAPVLPASKFAMEYHVASDGATVNVWVV